MSGPRQFQNCGNTTITQTIRYYCGYLDYKTKRNAKIINTNICLSNTNVYDKRTLPNSGNGIGITLDCSSS